MKKVLFIGPYRQQDGWGEAARALISSLLTTDIDLTLRHVVLAPSLVTEHPKWEKFKSLETKTSPNYDIIVQNVLPELFSWKYGSKNIGFFSSETGNLRYTPWIGPCNLMDEIWVHSSVEKKHLIDAGCTVPIATIGAATNIEQFSLCKKNVSHSNFGFYSIGNGERKNFLALILAFHLEFDPNEPVSLTIKEAGNAQSLSNAIQNYKQMLGIHKNIHQYKRENLITTFLEEDELWQLHCDNDCFVMPSYGEAWCRPALDAMGYGNTPIVTNNTGMIDFIDDSNGWIINSHAMPVLTNQKPLPYIYTAKEIWQQVDILHLCKLMREAYENTPLKRQKAKKGQKDIQQYSYVNIGRKLYDKLCK